MLSAAAMYRTPPRKFGSRAGSVARALGVQSHETWQVITGLLSAELEPSRTVENPHICQLFCSTSSANSNTVITIASSCPRSYSHGHYYACVDHYYACVVIMYACMRCACAPCTCVRVCGSVTRLLLVGKDTYNVYFFIIIHVCLNGDYISVDGYAPPAFTQRQALI